MSRRLRSDLAFLLIAVGAIAVVLAAVLGLHALVGDAAGAPAAFISDRLAR